MIRVHLRGTFVVSRPACRHWRAQAKEHGTHVRAADQHRDRAACSTAAPGQSNYVAAKAGINAFTEAVATEMAPYGVTANTIMPGANTRLAQIGWRTARAIEPTAAREQAQRPARPGARRRARLLPRVTRGGAGSRARRSRCTAGPIEHVGTWQVARTWQRDDRGFTADELARELPLDARRRSRPTAPPRMDRRSRERDLSARAMTACQMRAAGEVAVVDRAVGEARARPRRRRDAPRASSPAARGRARRSRRRGCGSPRGRRAASRWRTTSRRRRSPRGRRSRPPRCSGRQRTPARTARGSAFCIVSASSSSGECSGVTTVTSTPALGEVVADADRLDVADRVEDHDVLAERVGFERARARGR